MMNCYVLYLSSQYQNQIKAYITLGINEINFLFHIIVIQHGDYFLSVLVSTVA